jgi:hypothetical protein
MDCSLGIEKLNAFNAKNNHNSLMLAKASLLIMVLMFLCIIWLSFILVANILALPVADELQWSLHNKQPLRFTKEDTFQISVFADLHYGEGMSSALRMTDAILKYSSAENLDWGPQQDINTTRVVNTVLGIESPQLVVLNGDLITGENTYTTNSSLYLDEIVRPLVQRGLTWASTYGNHDSSFNLSSECILDREQKYSGSRTQRMVFSPSAGVTNYYLPVFSAESEARPVLILWFFDSRGGSHFQEHDASGNDIPYPNFVDESVSYARNYCGLSPFWSVGSSLKTLSLTK